MMKMKSRMLIILFTLVLLLSMASSVISREDGFVPLKPSPSSRTSTHVSSSIVLFCFFYLSLMWYQNMVTEIVNHHSIPFFTRVHNSYFLKLRVHNSFRQKIFFLAIYSEIRDSTVYQKNPIKRFCIFLLRYQHNT